MPPLPELSPRIAGLDAARALFACLRDATVETVAVAYLDPNRRLLGMRHVVGGRDRVAISIRTVAVDALAFGAVGVVMAHNHPSGDATPSGRDVAFTRALAAGLRTLEVVLLDHLVIAGDEVTSLRAMGVV
ncbi:JAB domain-containing protein [Sphingomonas faeni]|uniref:JAB domain-containing protein n=1 Tax=Sphingomonas faeni TaxID=185950 RepID=UPI0027884383|nr:JAB domain-containing protein [Sphingomonas faeni]MDQ0839639.1 DNA repair protein RadC [Sphingomonas faeni]